VSGHTNGDLKLVLMAVGVFYTRPKVCSVKSRAKAQSENWVISIARMRCMETRCSLFPIYCRLPKLYVANVHRRDQ
jgi:hypothetical protein